MITPEISNKLDEFFALNRGEMIADTAALVNINSTRGAALPGKPFGEGPAKALEAAGEVLSKHGFTPENHGNYFLTADAMPENSGSEDTPQLAMLAHMDVVEEGEGWTYPPYTLTLDRGTEEGIEGEIMYGRGTSDDKGPAIAAIYALKAAMSISPLKKGVRIILGSSEETGSEDMDHYRNTCKMPPMVFSPDADFPLINIEKGRYAPTFCASLRHSGSASSTTGELKLISFRGGETANIVPHKASCVVSGIKKNELQALISKLTDGTDLSSVTFDLDEAGRGENITVTAKGKGSHAAFPSGGINAQAALVKLLLKLPLSAESNVASYLGALDSILPFGDTDGTAMGIKMSDEKSGELTCAFTVLSIDNDTVSGQIDIRSPICGTEENVALVVNEKLTAGGFTVTGGKMVPPHCVPEDSELVKALLASYEDVTGQKGECLAIGGGTYVHHIDGGVAFGCAMPNVDYRIHGANEFMPVDELISSAKIFAAAILKLCC